MLEKTRRIIKNGQFRGAGNIGHKTQNNDKDLWPLSKT